MDECFLQGLPPEKLRTKRERDLKDQAVEKSLRDTCRCKWQHLEHLMLYNPRQPPFFFSTYGHFFLGWVSSRWQLGSQVFHCGALI